VTPAAGNRGFALVIALTLLALLVLIIVALSALARVNSRIAAASMQQAQARQNSLLALQVALGELQRHAGPDGRNTGMAGVAGIAPQNTFRQWTGVWGGTISPVWLVSGADNSPVPSLPGARVIMVGSHTVGSPTNSTDQEPVEVGLIEVPGPTPSGTLRTTGRLGYWVGDEGIKASAVISDEELQFSGATGVGVRPNFRRLIGSTFVPGSASNGKLIALEQLKIDVGGFSLGPAFHSVTLSHHALTATADGGSPRPGDYVVGAFNVNTTSESAWRAFLEFPDSANSVFGLDGARTLSAARQIRDRIAARGRPFESPSDLLASGLIQQSFDHASPKVTTVTEGDFLAELRPILAARSDTFRIRGYGDTLSLADGTTVEASAYCEAIVQRIPAMASTGMGRRFVVTYFRWLGRDDI